MQVVDWISRQAGRLADNFNSYKFYVKQSPDRIDSSAILSLSVYASRDQEAVVPALFRWFRIKNGLVAEVEEFRGNTFICEPADVGCTLQAEITSTDPQYPGTATLKYGPVELDILLRETVESALGVGEARFSVDVFEGETAKQCALTITDEAIAIAHCNSAALLRFPYSLADPLLHTFPRDPTRIAFLLGQRLEAEALRFLQEVLREAAGKGAEVQLRFLNRRQKDELLFIMRGFNARKELRNSVVMSQVERLQVRGESLDLALQVESLKGDLLRLFAVARRQQAEKLTYYEESCKLEQEIEDIISSYTKLIEGKFRNREQFEESFAEFEHRKDQALAHKYQRIEDENNRLRQFIRESMDRDLPEAGLNLQAALNQGALDLQAALPLPRTPDNPFLRKKEPFAEINRESEVLNRENYEQLLNNLSREEGEQGQQGQQRQQQEAEVVARSTKASKSVVIDSNEPNLSSSRHNMSALEISTSKVIEEKLTLEKKYALLKEEYRKLKAAYSQRHSHEHSQDRPGGEHRPDRPEGEHRPDRPEGEAQTAEAARLLEQVSQLEGERQGLRLKCELVGVQLKREREEHERTRLRLQRKSAELSQEISLSRRSNDALNRSQHLSMEMEDYNAEQNRLLREQVAFLESENDRLTKMCEKYKAEYKRLKEIHRLSSPQ